MTARAAVARPDAPLSRPAATPRRRLSSRALASAATVAAILALWSAASTRGWVSPLFLPSPLAVLKAGWSVATAGFVDSTLFGHLGASLARVFAALVFSVAVAVPAGFAIALSPVGRGLLDPVIEVLRPLPPLAYLPLVIIWVGIGEASKVLVIALAMIPPIALATASGARATPRSRIDAARALGASPAHVAWLVIAPSAAPSILTGVRIGLGAGWSTLVAAELVAATRGLGFMIQAAAQFLVTDVVIVGILAIAAVAIALEAGLRRIERRLVPWGDKS